MDTSKHLDTGLWLLVTIVIGCAIRDILFAPREIADLTINTFAGHEWKYNVWRMLAMADALSEGSSGRWIESFSFGWGYPIFYYTAPLPYTLGALLIVLGFDPVAALNISWISIYFLAGFAMYWAMCPILGKCGAVLATVCYIFAPYHLVDTYVRTNLVETTAFIFPPLIVRALWIADQHWTKATVLGALGIMSIPLTHMLSTYLIGVGLGIFTLVFIVTGPVETRFAVGRATVLMLGGGFLASAFFWLPAVMDLNAVRGFEAITEGYYHYANHFVYPEQLVDSRWHYGGSEIGPVDYMSFSLGKTILVIVSLTLCLVLVFRLLPFLMSCWDTCLSMLRQTQRGQRKTQATTASVDHERRKFSALLTACVLSAAVMVFLTTSYSAWWWEVIPRMEAVQFPWRFLFPACFFLAIAAGCLPKCAAQLMENITFSQNVFSAGARRSQVYVGVTVVSTVVASAAVLCNHWQYAKPGDHTAMARTEQAATYQQTTGVWTTNTLEFMPKDVQYFPHAGTYPQVNGIYYDTLFTEQTRILDSESGHGYAKFILLRGGAGKLVLNQHWHPAWKVLIDGRSATTKTFDDSHKVIKTRPLLEHPFAPVMVDIPADTREVIFYFGFTPAGKVGLALSVTILLIGAICLSCHHRSLLYRIRLPLSGIASMLLLLHFSGSALMHRGNSTSLEINAQEFSQHVAIHELQQIKIRGSRWDAPGNILLSGNGVLVTGFDPSILKQQRTQRSLLEFSADANDSYELRFFRDDELVYDIDIAADKHQAGLTIHQLLLPQELSHSGFDSIGLRPISGDGFYSLGHVVLRKEEKPIARNGEQDEHTSSATSNTDFKGKTVPLAVLSSPQRNGASWNTAGAQIFTWDGLAIELERISHARALKLSVDSNDSYAVHFFKQRRVLGVSMLPISQDRVQGLFEQQISVPPNVQQSGFDRITLKPIYGDQLFSLGHVALVENLN
ncbi:hypothetical protein TDB9533_03398 [Thalassocella blandensis]|nr:hypothetical protein TDB9533_03398 [Thalassocella blandensis]